MTGRGQHESLQMPPSAACIFILKSFYWSIVALQYCVSFLLYSKLSVCVCVCVYTCMLSCFSCVPLFVTVWIVALQAPLITGFSRQEYWSVLPCPPPGGLLNPGIQCASPATLALQADSLLLSHQGSQGIQLSPLFWTSTPFRSPQSIG